MSTAPPCDTRGTGGNKRQRDEEGTGGNKRQRGGAVDGSMVHLNLDETASLRLKHRNILFLVYKFAPPGGHGSSAAPRGSGPRGKYGGKSRSLRYATPSQSVTTRRPPSRRETSAASSIPDASSVRSIGVDGIPVTIISSTLRAR